MLYSGIFIRRDIHGLDFRRLRQRDKRVIVEVVVVEDKPLENHVLYAGSVDNLDRFRNMPVLAEVDVMPSISCPSSSSRRLRLLQKAMELGKFRIRVQIQEGGDRHNHQGQESST